ncbi:polysaccharide deacetylase family protein [Tepidibacter mesophilus]|uniref:polysaccharide deacetylase family protein n=1 Tax=Tepidibacter mesophilus TaxID=655607 RepID=UPI000C08CCDF|nr:polysaccharide deacetylase family protein [Tepidibacter mesophilus]
MIFIIKKKKVITLTLIILAIGIMSIITNYSITCFDNKQEPFYKGDKENSNHVAITCNVDWGNEYIDSMLKTLKEENVKITFMVTGRWADKYPDILMKIKSDGHEIGNHGYKHTDYSKLDYQSNYDEIKKSKNIIDNIINEDTKFFEPPSGYYSENTVKAAFDLNYIPVKWTLDTIDWKYKDNPEEIVNRIKSKGVEESGIILMHPTEATSQSLKSIIETVRNSGYEVGRLSDIFDI